MLSRENEENSTPKSSMGPGEEVEDATPRSSQEVKNEECRSETVLVEEGASSAADETAVPTGDLPHTISPVEETRDTPLEGDIVSGTHHRPPPIDTGDNALSAAEIRVNTLGTEEQEKEEKKHETYFLYINRFTLIDTAEETNQWGHRAKHQWGDSSLGSSASGLAVRVSSHTLVRGKTSPKPIQFSSAWTGITWSKHETGFLVPLEDDALIVVEIVAAAWGNEGSGPAHHSIAVSPERVLGMNIVNAQAIVDEERQWGKFCVHLLPNLCPLDSQTVHAVLELSILTGTAVREEEEAEWSRKQNTDEDTMCCNREEPIDYGEEGVASSSQTKKDGGLSPSTAPSSLVAAATGTATGTNPSGDVGFTTLEFNYGAVRVSTVDFFYPSFFLSGTGQYIVSNVLCAMNMTESSALAMQLVPLKEACDYIQVSPPVVMTVRPQQRAYFTATWDLKRLPYRSGPRLELELLVHGSQTPTARILLQVHHTVPHSTTSDVPYMYWVNNTCLCNRQMISPEELPLLKEVLPVYLLLSSAKRWGGQSSRNNVVKGGRSAARAEGAAFGSSPPPPAFGTESGSGNSGMYTGTHRAPLLYSGATSELDDALDINASFVLSASARGEMLDAVAAATAAAEQTATPSHPHPLLATNNNENTRIGGASQSRVYHRGPLLNIQERTCRCTITLGPIRGFPFLESASGQPNAFRIAITLLDKVGWKIVVGETRPSYPTASGSLQWNESLTLQKWPGATNFQFCRLHLSEVRSTDGDETPIGAGLISLPSLSKIHECVPLFVAFSVYETYSQYDQMNSPSLLMKDITLRFYDVR